MTGVGIRERVVGDGEKWVSEISRKDRMWGEREGEFQDVLGFGPCILKDGAVPA